MRDRGREVRPRHSTSAAGAGRRRGTATRCPRPGLTAGLTAALLAVPLLALPPAALPEAAAAPAAPSAPSAPAPSAPAPDPERPVTVSLTRLDPRTVAPGGTVTLAGTLTNTGTEALTDLGVRLQRGEAVTSRAELLANDADPDPATAVTAPFQSVEGTLEPGGTLSFTYAVTTGDLRMDRDGVYPVLLNVNGTDPEGEPSRVGEIATSVVQQTVAPPAATSVAWLWPLVERTHRDASGDFLDDDLTALVSEGGRLDRALAVLERLPTVLAPGAPTATPVAPVTVAVDPALVEELSLMAEGPYDVAGEEAAGSGTQEAAAWLERLRAVAADHTVLALSYGDVDADALQAAGLPGAVVRSLPAVSAPPAAAAPATPAGPGDDVTGDSRPVQISVGAVALSTVTPGAAVTVSGTLTNTGSEPIENLNIRLQRAEVLTT